MKQIITTALLLSLSLSIHAGTDWQPKLSESAAGSFRGPSDEIRLYIPPDLPAAVIEYLYLELDGINVTHMVQLDGDYAVYTPVQPLTWGNHRLRLLEYDADGNATEKGSWILEVRKSAAFRETALKVDAALEISQRVAEKNLTDPPDRTQGSGSLNLQGTLDDGNWRTEVKLPFIYNSLDEERQFEIGEYLLGWQWLSLGAKVGHHQIDHESLVLSGFNRRGVSATYASTDKTVSVTGFAMHGSKISGFNEGLGVTDEEDRVEGAVVSLYPIKDSNKSLQIAAAYLHGKAPEAGTSVGGDEEALGGDAFTTSADLSLLEDRFRLRGEYAHSRYDFDGKGGSGAEEDYGYALLLSYKPWKKLLVLGSNMDWVLGLEYQRLGTFLRSPANPAATADRKKVQFHSDLTWGGLGSKLQFVQETDNVEDIAILPRLCDHNMPD